MNQRDAFTLAVADTPDDDAPRLVFADWLEEEGDAAWAAFIRAQCALARLPEDDPARTRHEAEAASLLPAMQARLRDKDDPRHFGRLAGWVREQQPDFERGFVARLFTTPTKFLARAGEVMRAAPVQHVTFNNAGYKADDWLASPHLARLRSLGLAHNRIAHLIPGLAAVPALAGLKGLDLTNTRFRIAGAEALAASPHLAGLERLTLSGNRIHDRGPEALAGSPHLANLRRLALRGCQVGERGAIVLARSPHLRRLEWLDLGENFVRPGGVAALADADSFPNLAHLDLTRGRLPLASLRPLLDPSGLPALRSLAVTAESASGETARVWSLEVGPKSRGRLELHLHDWGTPPRADEIRSSPLIAGLAGLHLASGRWDDLRAAQLASSPAARGLKALSLDHCALSDAGLVALGESPQLSNLTRLSVTYDRFSVEGIERFARSPMARRLTHLDLSSWSMSGAALNALAKADGLGALVRLRLLANAPQAGQEALRERFGWRVVFA